MSDHSSKSESEKSKQSSKTKNVDSSKTTTNKLILTSRNSSTIPKYKQTSLTLMKVEQKPQSVEKKADGPKDISEIVELGAQINVGDDQIDSG